MYYGEKFNSISHLVGAVLSLVGFGALLTVSIEYRSLPMIVGFLVFGITLVLLYTMSTLYHSFHPPKLKRVFQKLDHISIYLLIAGTYTPYMLVSLGDGNGIILLSIIWGLAFIGLVLDTLNPNRLEVVQTVIYIMMGWACVFEYSNLKASIPEPGVVWLTVGGLAYTIGVLFYVLHNIKVLRSGHGIWHLFVLSGSLCHFISIIGYVR